MERALVNFLDSPISYPYSGIAAGIGLSQATTIAKALLEGRLVRPCKIHS